MSSEMSSQYEIVGNRIAQYLKTVDPSRELLQNQLTSFLGKYAMAPLFIVGIDDAIYQQWLTSQHQEKIAEFRLPFPTMVLDFPSGLLQKSENPQDG